MSANPTRLNLPNGTPTTNRKWPLALRPARFLRRLARLNWKSSGRKPRPFARRS